MNAFVVLWLQIALLSMPNPLDRTDGVLEKTYCLSPSVQINLGAVKELFQVEMFEAVEKDGIQLIENGRSELLESFVLLETKSIPKKFRWNEKRLKAVLNDSDYLKFVLVEGAEIMGYAVFDLKLNSLARIGVLSKNQGKGTMLLQAVIQHLVQRGIADFTIFPLKEVVRFYELFAQKGNMISLAEGSGLILQFVINKTVFVEQAI